MACVRFDEHVFRSQPAVSRGGQASYGYPRDQRQACEQVVIALKTPEGLPLAYGVLPGNTPDMTTLRSFLDRIESQ
jgi:transposase